LSQLKRRNDIQEKRKKEEDAKKEIEDRQKKQGQLTGAFRVVQGKVK